MFERRVHALVAGLVLLAIALAVTIVVALDRGGSAVQNADDRWLAWMTSIRTEWLDRIARVMSVLGGPFVMVPLRLTVIGALARHRRWLQLGAFAGATVASELCIGPLKALIDRPRPPGALIETTSSSFPSGHAVAASVTAIGLVVVLVPAAGRRTRWTVMAASFAAVMAMSRTYLGAHWLSDVVAGSCIGTGLAVVWSAGLELARAHRQVTERATAVPGHQIGSRTFRVVGVGLLCIGLACVVGLHVLRLDLGPAGHRISEYAIGPYGYVMTAAFVSIGAGLVVIGAALPTTRRQSSRGVGAAIVLAGLCMISAGIWRTDADRSGVLTDAIHSRASAAATILLIGAALAWSVILRTPGARRRDLAAALAVLAAILGAISPAVHRSALTGISQRLLWLTLLAWSVSTAWRLTSPAPNAVSERPEPDVTMSTR